MAFFESLGKAINEQYGFGENTINSLDATGDRTVNYGLLGEFANKFDQSAERTYIEDGFIRNVRPHMREILWQQPDVTIVVKKRMFSSLADNFRADLLNNEEKLFLRASKRMFQNKCRAIAAYERLSKVEKIVENSGVLNSFMMPTILEGFSILEDVGLGGIFGEKTRFALETLRKVHAFSEPTGITTWMIDNQTPFMDSLGEGTGVIDLTMAASVSTTVSTEFMGGSATITLESPYKLLVIDESDIDRAIADATNTFVSGGFGRLTEQQTKKLIEDQKSQLQALRQARRASPIQFIVSPQTLISKRVRAIMEAEGREIKFHYDSAILGLNPSPGFPGFVRAGVEIDSQEFLGPNGLTNQEADLFSDLIRNIYLLIGFQNTTRNERFEFNKENNYVRRKMRTHFLGKYIIQPMDIVNIFITSKTQTDTKLTAGFESQSRGLNLGNKIDSLVKNINTNLGNLSSMFGGTAYSADEAEKDAIVGPDFPTWLWRLFRNDFTRQAAGTSVFVGLADSPTENYSNGKYVLTITCKDNSSYFDKSQINLKPALDVFNSTLYDPLTPFKISFDEATGTVLTDSQNEFPELLDENKRLLESEAIRFKNGRFRGSKASEALLQARNVELSFNNFRSILHEPDGFVYRWKQGIGSLTKTERAIVEASNRAERSPLLTRDPFAGQDVMNVLSLLVTGQPYNYNSFLKAAIMNANSIVNRNELTNQDVGVSYIEGLTADLAKRNAIWGNFIPFKKLVLSDATDTFIRTGEADLLKLNQRILSLTQQRAKLQDELILLKREYAVEGVRSISRDASGQAQPLPEGSSINQKPGNLERQIAALDREIDDYRRRFDITVEDQISNKEFGNIKIIGNDIATDPSLSETDGSRTERQRKQNQRDFRNKIDFLTLRRLWKVKANEDPNLFIIDDQYDKSFDIQAFERRLGSRLNLFDSEYTTIDGKIKQVADLLGLEIFADTQGHIQVRPPAYNKTPSSVFYRMFKDRNEKGIQVFPQFLESLFFNQLKGITNRLEIIEDEIRLRLGALGASTDEDAQSILSKQSYNFNFKFVTSRATGSFNNSLFNSLVSQASVPELNEELVSGLRTVSDTFAQNSSKRRMFDVTSRLDLIRDQKFTSGIAHESNSQLEEIRKRLARKKGTEAQTIDSLFSNKRFSKVDAVSQMDVFNILNQIAQFVSERQDLLLQGVNVIKNIEEGATLNLSGDGATSALFPHLNRKKEIPEILEHMILDETDNDLGPSAGERYIIRENQIISASFSEVPPNYTLVQVNGLFQEGFVDPATSLRLTSNDGNALTSAFAVDYDMWQMYGFRATQSVPAPFFEDPDAQCAPYAVYLLNLARADILQGSLTLVGNEYYQPGDVVYVEHRNLLYYVKSVQHSFDYSGSFTTTLTLRYGHPPGDYIPTILDIVGKHLYNNRQVSTQFRSERFGNANGDIPIGALIVETLVAQAEVSLQTPEEILLSGPKGEQNRKVLSNMLLALSGALNPVGLRRVRPVLELRLYTDSAPNTTLVDVAEVAAKWMADPRRETVTNNSIIPSVDPDSFVLPTDNIKVVVIDYSEGVKSTVFPAGSTVTSVSSDSSPSSSAWNIVRNLSSNSNNDDVILFNNVIDAWITFENLDETLETGTNQPLSQEAQEFNDSVLEAQRKFAGI